MSTETKARNWTLEDEEDDMEGTFWLLAILDIETNNIDVVAIIPRADDVEYDEQMVRGRTRLIAAAPDLLAALEELRNCHTGASWQTHKIRDKVWQKARAAIAKATG